MKHKAFEFILGTTLIAFIVVHASTHVPLLMVCAITFMLMVYAMLK